MAFCLFLRIEHNINFSLMIISTVFCLYSIEFILTIIKDKRSTAAGEKFIPEKILQENQILILEIDYKFI